jgi:hypothetical protein
LTIFTWTSRSTLWLRFSAFPKVGIFGKGFSDKILWIAIERTRDDEDGMQRRVPAPSLHAADCREVQARLGGKCHLTKTSLVAVPSNDFPENCP